ncbi:MAG: hypothetical protein KTR17_01995, partial [Cellvibrionaceae bacterium]|nr:hypothetical protein [Cellvibrionaceae bacterium]
TLYIKSDYSSGWLAPVGEEQEQDVNDERDSPRSNIAGAYAPFEFYRAQWDQSVQGPWSDIYSLAAIVYQVIAGKPPRDALARASVILDGKDDPYESLVQQSSRYLKYSPAFLRAVDSALNFKAHQRPQSVELWSKMLLGKSDPVARRKSHSFASTPTAISSDDKNRSAAGKLRARNRAAMAIESPMLEAVAASSKQSLFQTLIFRGLAAVLCCACLGFAAGAFLDSSRPGTFFSASGLRGGDEAEPVNAMVEKLQVSRKVRLELEQKISPIKQLEEKIARLDAATVPYSFKLLTRYQLYRDILKIEPYHADSLQGIDAIHRDIVESAGIALRDGKLKSAQTRLNLLKQIGGSEEAIQKIELSVEQLQAEQAVTAIAAVTNKPVVTKAERVVAKAPPAPKVPQPAVAKSDKVSSVKVSVTKNKPEINYDPSVDAALRKIETFNVSFELGDLLALETIAKVSDKNKQFLNLLFEEYSLTNLEITKVNHIKSKNVVEAQVEITKLINRDGYMVDPSQSWSTIPLTAKFNENSGWVVFW